MKILKTKFFFDLLFAFIVLIIFIFIAGVFINKIFILLFLKRLINTCGTAIQRWSTNGKSNI